VHLFSNWLTMPCSYCVSLIYTPKMTVFILSMDKTLKLKLTLKKKLMYTFRMYGEVCLHLISCMFSRNTDKFAQIYWFSEVPADCLGFLTSSNTVTCWASCNFTVNVTLPANVNTTCEWHNGRSVIVIVCRIKLLCDCVTSGLPLLQLHGYLVFTVKMGLTLPSNMPCFYVIRGCHIFL
jgi:hypothetical protein